MGNTASRNHAGYWVPEASDGTILRGNVANSNTFGIVFYDTGHSILENNTANSNAASGIHILRGHENQLTTNTTNLNGSFGIEVDASNGNVLSGNTANLNTWVGIELLGGSSDNTILENVARRNGIFDAARDFTGTGNVWTNNNFGTTEGIE